jgi:hypothetical protein
MFTTLLPQNFNKQIVANWDVWHHFLTTLVETFPPSCEAFQLNLNCLFHPNQHLNKWDLSRETLQLNLNYLLCPNQNLNGWDSSCEAFQLNLNYKYLLSKSKFEWMRLTMWSFSIELELFHPNQNLNGSWDSFETIFVFKPFNYSYLPWNKFLLGTWTKIWEIVFWE